MSIIDEQNILGNSALATATRPGSSMPARDYSFVRANEVKEVAKTIIIPHWIQANSYAPNTEVAEATDAPPTSVIGPAAEPELSSATEYGTQGGQALTENAEQTSPLEQVAEVIAEEVEPAEPILPPMYSSFVKSETITEEGEQGPIASGGQFNGYEAQNQYFQNPQANRGAGATTVPAPIESTGIRGQVSVSPMEAMAAAQSPGNDNPQANRGQNQQPGAQPPRRPMGNSQGSRGQRNKTTGSSAQKSQTQQPGAQPPKVHKVIGGPMYGSTAATPPADISAMMAATMDQSGRGSSAADPSGQSGRGA